MIVKVNNNVKKCISPILMENGQIGIVRNGVERFAAYNEHFVFKHFGGLVSLNEPSSTWSDLDGIWPNFQVELLTPGTEISLTVEK